jgi:putative NADH-flavin reductase
MKIAVIAANGRSGQAFVAAALAAGHQVRAGVYGHNPFESNPLLKVIKCDATNSRDVSSLIKGQDAVVSLIGHAHGITADVQSVAMRKIVDAMHRAHVDRIVSLTGTGVRYPGDQISLTDRILNFGLGLIDAHRIQDGNEHAEILGKSGLDWTIIRVLKLTDADPVDFQLVKHGPAKSLVSRQEVAQAILQVLTDRSFVQQAPIIGYPEPAR